MSRTKTGLVIAGRRNGNLLKRFPQLAVLADVLPAGTVIDGEIVAHDGSVASFASLMRPEDAAPIVLMAFDLLEHRGRDIMGKPLEERQQRLRQLVPMHPGITVTPDFEDGIALFEQAEIFGLEGIVAKKRGSIYEPGVRSPNWIKVKTGVGRMGQEERGEIFNRST